MPCWRVAGMSLPCVARSWVSRRNGIAIRKTGTVAPLTLGKQIDYRSEKVVGDIKYLWEPNRHLELVALAQAWKVTGERRYADGALTMLQSWFEQCPYPMGVHWTSSLELALRLLNWACAWNCWAAWRRRCSRARRASVSCNSGLPPFTSMRTLSRLFFAPLVGEQPSVRRIHGLVCGQ